MAVSQLVSQPVFEYDSELFLNAVDEAYRRWQENENYRDRIQRSGAPETISDFEDLYELPTVDMREFKEHPQDLLVGLDSIDEEDALFSSGTTADSKSVAVRTSDGLERQEDLLQRFADTCLSDIDYFAGFAPSDQILDALPVEVSNRAAFHYIRWLMDQFDPTFHIEMRDGQPAPDFAGIAERVRSEVGSGVVYGLTSHVEQFCEYLDDNNETLDLGANGTVVTGGGWKGTEAATKDEFREKLARSLGVEPENHCDWYGASEMYFFSGNMMGDPDPDKKRVSSQGFVYIADEDHFRTTGEIQPVENGEPGLLVAVDPVNPFFPGVILTDDRVVKTGGVYGEDVRIEHVSRSTL